MSQSPNGSSTNPMKEAAEEEERFRKLLPTTGLIADYMHYTDAHESPGSYHFWTIASIIAGTVQRRAWIDRGMYDIFPNLYVVLVGPSGRCRKTSAIRTGIELVQEFDWFNLTADRTTPEALLESLQWGTSNMAKDPDDPSKIQFDPDSTGFLRITELADFINKQTYMSGMVPLLTNLYDNPSYYKYTTRTKKSIFLQNVCLNILGASTPEWLANSLPEAAFEGGFMSRLLFIVKHHRDRVVAWGDKPNVARGDHIKQKIIDIRKHFKGHVPLSKEAYEWFEQWYKRLAETPLDDIQLSGFIERKPDTTLKLALILAAARNPQARMVKKDDLFTAQKIISWTQEKMFRAFENIDLSPLGSIKKKVYELVEQYGEITRRELMRKMGSKVSSLTQLREVEVMLQESGEIDIEVRTPKGGGKPSTLYKVAK